MKQNLNYMKIKKMDNLIKKLIYIVFINFKVIPRSDSIISKNFAKRISYLFE